MQYGVIPMTLSELRTMVLSLIAYDLEWSATSDAELRRVGFSDDEIIQYRKQGYLSSKPVVTNLLNPKYHGTGRAMDCCWLVNGAPTWNVPEEWWETYGRAAEAHGLKWGGRWKMRDLPHVQYEGE